MIRKTVSMPDAMGKYIDKRVRAGQYGNDSEYIRDLVRRDQASREAVAAVQAAIDEGMAGAGLEITPSQILRRVRRGAVRKRRAR
jgi:antitoxin ParD1/3/4